ncbi:MAG: hypothetical protein J0M30_14650 [Chitinophagales bacterium]|nr:hypothetical protein [Chitinophagales bacterium]
MPKILTKNKVNRKKPEQVVAILAEKHRVSKRYVNMVISGERQNEEILADYLTYHEEHNLLLKSVRETVTFN